MIQSAERNHCGKREQDVLLHRSCCNIHSKQDIPSDDGLCSRIHYKHCSALGCVEVVEVAVAVFVVVAAVAWLHVRVHVRVLAVQMVVVDVELVGDCICYQKHQNGRPCRRLCHFVFVVVVNLSGFIPDHELQLHMIHSALSVRQAFSTGRISPGHQFAKFCFVVLG